MSRRTEQLNAYIRSLRNPRKRDYARAYRAWREHEADPETEPRAEDFQPLGYMAAQAVRLQINNILERL